jgi:glycosyltransferase involved in cell wall biosynthesis
MKSASAPCLAHPTLVRRTSARQPWTWIVTEFGILENSRIADGRTAREALTTPGVRFMTPSRWSFDGLVRSGADPSNITIVPHGYDPRVLFPWDTQRRAEARRRRGWTDHFVYLNVSTLVWNKGIAGLLQAFAQIAPRYPHARLALKGNDEMLQSDRRLRESLAALPPAVAATIQSRIIYLGQNITFDEMAELFNAADAYVSPYHAEGFNMPALEAGACGLPVIVTQGGPTDDFAHPGYMLQIRAQPINHPELEKNHGPGARALMMDGMHLIQLMQQVIDDPAMRDRAREAGPAHLSQSFTWRHVVDRMLAALVPEYRPES